MQIHADLTQRAVVFTDEIPWVDSPLPGVERRMLDRDGGEVARATSLVRYAPDSSFSAHTHGGGEEFLVLEGVFSDEMGDFPKGMYVRNPVGSRHTPFSKQGATIFVKLQQFDPADQTFVRIDTHNSEWQPSARHGVWVMPLHEFGSEIVQLVRWEPGTRLMDHGHVGGEEILVLEGSLSEETRDFPRGTWIRNPPGSKSNLHTAQGCTLYVKTGHLQQATDA